VNNTEATGWLLDTLTGATGGAPLSEREIRSVPTFEIVSTQFKPEVEGNRLIVRLPVEQGGEVTEVEYLITVERVFK